MKEEIFFVFVVLRTWSMIRFRFFSQVVKEGFSSKKRIETKSCAADLVTEYDRRVEDILIKSFKDKFPTHKSTKKKNSISLVDRGIFFSFQIHRRRIGFTRRSSSIYWRTNLDHRSDRWNDELHSRVKKKVETFFILSIDRKIHRIVCNS